MPCLFPIELREYLRRESRSEPLRRKAPNKHARDVTLGSTEQAWVEALPLEVRDRAVEAMAVLAA